MWRELQNKKKRPILPFLKEGKKLGYVAIDSQAIDGIDGIYEIVYVVVDKHGWAIFQNNICTLWCHIQICKFVQHHIHMPIDNRLLSESQITNKHRWFYVLHNNAHQHCRPFAQYDEIETHQDTLHPRVQIGLFWPFSDWNNIVESVIIHNKNCKQTTCLNFFIYLFFLY